MQQKKQLAKNTLILAIGKICTQSFSFFLLPLYTSTLTTEEYGLVDLILTYTALALPLVYFQFDQAIFRFLIDVRQNGQERKELITTVCIFSVLQMLLLVGFFCLIQWFIASELKWYLLYMILANIASSCLFQISRGLGDTLGYTLGNAVSAITQVTCNILFLLVWNMGAAGMLLATILGHVFAALFLLVREKVLRNVSFDSFRLTLLKEMFAYCIPLIPNQLSWWAITASDRIIVSAVLGASANGLISVGHKFSTMFVAAYNIFHLAWSESTALYINASEQERDRFFSSVVTDMFRLFMCAAIGVIACMPFAFPLLVHVSFQEAYYQVPIFMLATMFHVLTGLYAAIYVALKETKEIAKTSFMAGIVNIISHLLLIRYIGIYAAAISTVIGYGVMAISRYRNIQKRVSVQLEQKTVWLVICLYIITACAYYCGNLLVQGIVLLVVAVCSVMVNQRLLRQIIYETKRRNKK